MKKGMSVFTAFLLSFCIIIAPMTTVAAVDDTTPADDGTSSGTSTENDMSVTGTNSFGNLLSEEFADKQTEQQENMGNNIFSVEVENNVAKVDFETTKDSTIVVGIYDEQGVQMVTSANIAVTSEQKNVSVELDGDKMPDYFYIRAFIVESDTLKPMCTAYESPNYTQEMQEFFAKTIADFEEDKVLNLDENADNNFAVYSDDTKIIPESAEHNTVISADDENLVYVFGNIDSSVSSLKTDDVFVHNYDENNVLIVKVATINIDGTTATIQGQELSMKDVFDYIKIDGAFGAADAEVTPDSCVQGVTYNGIVDNKTTSTSSKATKTTSTSAFLPPIDINETFSQSLSYNFDTDLFDEKTKSENLKGKATVKGSVEFSISISVKLYSSDNYHYFEFKADYSLKDSVSVTGSIDARIPLGEIFFTPVPGLFVTFTPSVVFRANAKIELTATLKGCAGFRASNTEGIKDISKKPTINSEWKIEGTIFVGVSLEPSIKIIDNRIAKASLKAEAGIEAKATKSGKLLNSDTDVIHSCENCYDGTLSFKMTVSASASFLNNKNLKWTLTPVSLSEKIGDFYYSLDNHEFGMSNCPHKLYKVTFTVVDGADNKPLENVNVSINSDYYSTNEKGIIEIFMNGNTQEVTFFKDGYYMTSRNVYAKSDARKISVRLEKNDGSGSGTGTGDDGNSGYGYDDGGLGAIAAMSDTPIKDVQIYNGRTAVITKNGTLYMFGRGDYGQIGNGTFSTTNSIPQKIMTNVKSVSLGGVHTAALTNSGDLYMWGNNAYSQLGDGTTVNSSSPIKIMSNVKNVSLNYDSSYAVTNSGDLYSWGLNNYGQLGNGTNTNNNIPTKIMSNISSVYTFANMAAAITNSGDLYTWGNNNYGQLGIGAIGLNYDHYKIPVKVLSNVKKVVVNGMNTAAITNSNELYVWGNNRLNELGTPNNQSPYKIMDNIRDVSFVMNPNYMNSNTSHIYAITLSNELYTWGYWQQSSLYRIISSPVKIANNVLFMSDNYYITNTGTLYCNSYNYGKEIFYQTIELTNCAKVYYAYRYSETEPVAAVTYDNGVVGGYLYMAGRNQYGQTGNGQSGDWQEGFTRINLNNAKTTSTSAAIKATNKLTKDYEDLEPYGVYNFYVMRSRTEYEPLNSENLYYITQGVADEEGRLSFTYAPTENYETADRFVTAMDRISIANAGAEISDMLYNGETQYAEPIIMLDDLQLVEGRDYELSGDFAAKDAGEYTLTVTGIGKYTGTLTLTYNMIMEFLNLSEIDKDSIILGEEINFNASAVGGDGNYTYTYYFRNVSDPYWSVLDMDSTETTMTFEPYKVGQYYARVDVRDGTGTIKRKAMTFEVLSKSLVNLSTISSNKIFTGSSVKLAGAAQGGQAPYRYAVYYKNVFDNKWKTAQNFDSNSIINLDFNAEGMYDVCIKVKDAYNSISKLYFAVTVENEKVLPLKNNSSISSTSVKLGGKLNVTAKAEGGKGKYVYAFYYKQSNKTAWTTLQNFAENTTVEIEPDTETVYDVCAKVKDESGTVVKKYFTFNVISPELVNTSKVLAESILQGETVKISATGRGGTAPYTFAVYTKLKDKTSWTTTQNFDKNSTISFKPTAAGEYDICVKVKDSDGEVVNKYFTLKVELNELKDLSTLSADKVVVGEEVTVNAVAKGGIGSYTYGVYYKQTSQSKWTTAQDFSTNATVTFKPTTATTYDVCIKIKDEEGTLIKTYLKITVTQPELENTSTISSETIKSGDSLTITSSAKGGSGSYTYGVYYKQTSQSKWTTAQDFSSNKIVSLKPAKSTNYDICVKVKDSQGTVAKKYFTVTVN